MSDTLDRPTRMQLYLDRMPFTRFLGVRHEIMGDEMTTILPFQDKLIGNASIQALHGGATGAFLELTAMMQLFLLTDVEKFPKPVNLTIDYYRQGKAEDLFARAYVTKAGRRIANVRAEAWQSERLKPVAALNAHFLVDEG